MDEAVGRRVPRLARGGRALLGGARPQRADRLRRRPEVHLDRGDDQLAAERRSQHRLQPSLLHPTAAVRHLSLSFFAFLFSSLLFRLFSLCI